MPGEAFRWMGRIKAVESEYGAIHYGMERLFALARNDPSILDDPVRLRDIANSLDNLEGTYIVRLFSEFEVSLRQFIRSIAIRTPGSAEGLVNRVQDRARIPQSFADNVHLVREYRNAVVHERSTAVGRVAIRQATSFLCTFLSRLERIW